MADGDARASAAVSGSAGADALGGSGSLGAGPGRAVEDLLRELAPQVLATLMRRYDRLDACEDAVQEALLDAAAQWAPHEASGTGAADPRAGAADEPGEASGADEAGSAGKPGEAGAAGEASGARVPGNPRGWLITVATRRLTDILRSDTARRRRESAVFLATPPAAMVDPPVASGADDSLALLFMCCHPALSPSSAVALTLRAVGGLGTAEIARAFGVSEATIGQRISRAKAAVRAAGARFALPSAAERAERLQVVLQVLYLVFNEGYTASAGESLVRVDLATEGIRLGRLLQRLAPADAEVAGLLALMLLTEARRPGRVGPDGALIPLLEQDRSLWDAALITEGCSLVAAALASSRALGPYQIQAAIAAAHDEAPSVAETDWAEVLALYQLLDAVAPSPAASLGRAVAVAQVHGVAAGLSVVTSVAADPSMRRSHRLFAVRAHLRERAEDVAGARADYRMAAGYATNLAEKRYLERRLASLAERGRA